MKENYYELTISISTNFRDIISDFLLENFCDAIEQKGDTIIVRSEEKLEIACFGVEQMARALNVEIETKIETKKNIDWIESYKKSIKSISVGRFFIYPSI